MGGLRQRAVDLAFALAWALVRRLPERTVTWLFRRAADRVVRRNGRAYGGCAATWPWSVRRRPPLSSMR